MDALAGVTLAILAGGRGERMGRAEGPALRIKRRPILEYLLDQFNLAGADAGW